MMALTEADERGSAYARAGVDIAAGQRATDLMKAAVQATYGPEVLAGIGAFGGLYDAAMVQALPRLCRGWTRFWRLPMLWLVDLDPPRYVKSAKHFPCPVPRLFQNLGL